LAGPQVQRKVHIIFMATDDVVRRAKGERCLHAHVRLRRGLVRCERRCRFLRQALAQPVGTTYVGPEGEGQREALITRPTALVPKLHGAAVHSRDLHSAPLGTAGAARCSATPCAVPVEELGGDAPQLRDAVGGHALERRRLEAVTGREKFRVGRRGVAEVLGDEPRDVWEDARWGITEVWPDHPVDGLAEPLFGMSCADQELRPWRRGARVVELLGLPRVLSGRRH